MPAEAAVWPKLRQRSTLLPNEQCLLDLHERVTALEEAQGSTRISPVSASLPVTEPAVEGADAPTAEPERLPDVTPISVQDRLPELHELDRQGRCWAYRSTTHEPLGKAWILGTPVSLQLTRPWCSFTHWLPYWSLPIVEEDPATP